jgi:hypothetical protein
MPEYLAPGVFVEETSFRSKSIEGVGTTTTGFVGPTRYGPIGLRLELVSSIVDFERAYGDQNQLAFGKDQVHNYMWHAARAFFTEGGNKLYVSRIFCRLDKVKPTADPFDAKYDNAALGPEGYLDGHARKRLGEKPEDARPAAGSVAPDAGGAAGEGGDEGAGRGAEPVRGDARRDSPAAKPPPGLLVRARWPGAAGNVTVRISISLGPNIYAGFDKKAGQPRLAGLSPRDVVLYASTPERPDAELPPGDLYIAAQEGLTWLLKKKEGNAVKLDQATLNGQKVGVYIVTATVAVTPTGGGDPMVWSGLPLDLHHRTNGVEDGLASWFWWYTEDRSQDSDVPIVFSFSEGVENGIDVLEALDSASNSPGILKKAGDGPTALRDSIKDKKRIEQRYIEFTLEGGNDGLQPEPDNYEGRADPKTNDPRTGLKQFEDVDEISIVAAPGSTSRYKGRHDDAESVLRLLIAHVERMRYRVAVLDSGDGQTVGEVKAMRGRFDSKHAALYYPWVRIEDPVTQSMIMLPPSGFIAGIYARNDITRGVHKAPANEVLRLSSGFESVINTSEQEILNPLGVNCMRFFEGRGFRVWGARTISSDPEWKYINVRRYFAYLEHSIDKGTQWAVFEPNGPLLWANVRRTIEDFLFNEFQNGSLLGDRSEQAYFVKCDRSTMTQNDLDNGRLICLVGVSPLKPAEFVIFRIGQWTADRKV